VSSPPPQQHIVHWGSALKNATMSSWECYRKQEILSNY
jgi:hypothetical protein